MPTQLIRGLHNIAPHHRGGVMTIGNFDGVHRGHQELIGQVVKQAKMQGVPSLVITFEPHAFEFFSAKELKIPRLTRLREKFYGLADCGVDYVLVLRFDEAFAALSAHDFIEKILRGYLQPKRIIIGDDFRFGRERQGNFVFLKEQGDFIVEAMPTVKVDGERVSSTRVRKALAEGDHALVKRLLGHPYFMHGRVMYGDQRGRLLGFPTANIFLHRKLTPVQGVYTVYVHDIAHHSWPGVANVGMRPTVDGTRSLLEVHLLDFDQEIYRRYVRVEFCKKLRDEQRFSTLALLQEQITKDVNDARNYFVKSGAL